MNLAVVGSRTFHNYDLLQHHLDQYNFTTIVTGSWGGVDNLAERYGWTHSKKLSLFYPTFSKYGKLSIPIHDVDVVDASDGVIAFWDSYSVGTRNILKYCQSIGKPFKIIHF